ncbi:hypothetical protein HaLaN_32829, partial [Haematococcus lacustris]
MAGRWALSYRQRGSSCMPQEKLLLHRIKLAAPCPNFRGSSQRGLPGMALCIVASPAINSAP